MIKERWQSKVAATGNVLVPSSALLDSHFEELLEAIEEIRGLTALPKALSPSSADEMNMRGGCTQP